jgi:hypothetical protein
MGKFDENMIVFVRWERIAQIAVQVEADVGQGHA